MIIRLTVLVLVATVTNPERYPKIPSELASGVTLTHIKVETHHHCPLQLKL